jgi:hypothetical protein
MDTTDDVILVQLSEGISQRATGAFCCVASSPEFSAERPANFETRPALGVEEAEPPEKSAAALFLNRPMTVAAQLPMANHERHMPPGFRSVESLAAKKAHHLGIGADLRIVFEIVITPHTQDEAFSFKSYFGHKAGCLFLFPAHAVFCVFEDYAAACEFIANFVAAAKVATAASFLAFVDQILDFAVQHSLLLGPKDV